MNTNLTKILIIGIVASALLLAGVISYSSNLSFGATTRLGVQGGGTGATGFPKYPIVGGSGTNALSASSTLWVAGINATSTTASSTFQGLQAQSIDVQSTSATSTFANGLRFSGGNIQTLLTSCNGDSVLETDALGNLQCGTDAGGAGSAFAWTPRSDGNATTTRILLDNGFISSASSTIAGNLSVSTLSSGLIGNGNGLLYGGIATGTVSGTGGVTVTASRSAIGGALAIDCTAAGSGSTGCLSSTDWTTFNNKAGFAYLFPSNATTSSLTIGGILSTASSTFSSNLDLSGGTVKQLKAIRFGYATSTAWTGTTTRDMGPAEGNERWIAATCRTVTAGTLNIRFGDGTNFMNIISASSTFARFTLTNNNTFIPDEPMVFQAGTPGSSPVEFSCRIDRIVNN